MPALEFYQGGVLVKSINICENRAYQSQSLSFNSSRKPNTVSDTLVLASVQLEVTDGQSSTIEAQIDSGSGFVTIASVFNGFTLTGLGIGGTVTNTQLLSFIVPANCDYKLINTGTGIETISGVYELTL